MKRLVVNAFCPGEHKVISSHAAKPAKRHRFGPVQSKLCPCDLDENTRSKDRVRGQFGHFGLWLSLVERLVRDQEAVGSNPTSPIHSIAESVAVLVSAPESQKTGVWHKRLYTVIVEIPLFLCIPLSRS